MNGIRVIVKGRMLTSAIRGVAHGSVWSHGSNSSTNHA